MKRKRKNRSINLRVYDYDEIATRSLAVDKATKKYANNYN